MCFGGIPDGVLVSCKGISGQIDSGIVGQVQTRAAGATDGSARNIRGSTASSVAVAVVAQVNTIGSYIDNTGVRQVQTGAGSRNTAIGSTCTGNAQLIGSDGGAGTGEQVGSRDAVLAAVVDAGIVQGYTSFIYQQSVGGVQDIAAVQHMRRVCAQLDARPDTVGGTGVVGGKGDTIGIQGTVVYIQSQVVIESHLYTAFNRKRRGVTHRDVAGDYDR